MLIQWFIGGKFSLVMVESPLWLDSSVGWPWNWSWKHRYPTVVFVDHQWIQPPYPSTINNLPICYPCLHQDENCRKWCTILSMNMSHGTSIILIPNSIHKLYHYIILNSICIYYIQLSMRNLQVPRIGWVRSGPLLRAIPVWSFGSSALRWCPPACSVLRQRNRGFS